MDEFLIKELEIVAYFSQYSNEGVKVSLYEEQPEKRIKNEPEKRIVEQAKPLEKYNESEFELFYKRRLNDTTEPEKHFVIWEMERLNKLLNPFKDEHIQHKFKHRLKENIPIVYKWLGFLDMKKESITDFKKAEPPKQKQGIEQADGIIYVLCKYFENEAKHYNTKGFKSLKKYFESEKDNQQVSFSYFKRLWYEIPKDNATQKQYLTKQNLDICVNLLKGNAKEKAKEKLKELYTG